jgi:hypothetical protein
MPPAGAIVLPNYRTAIPERITVAPEPDAVRLEGLMPGRDDDDPRRAMEAPQAQPPSTVNWGRRCARPLEELEFERFCPGSCRFAVPRDPATLAGNEAFGNTTAWSVD